MMRFLSRWFARWRRATADEASGGASPSAAAPASQASDMPGAHGAMPMLDCESVMRQLWDYLDGELTSQRMAAIRAHLEHCKRCYPQYEFERSFLEAVAASARQHSNLEELRVRLAARLQEQGMTGA